MIIRVTTKLSKKLHIAPGKSLPADENPFVDWSAHLFTVNRTQYILISNTASLYSMIMYGRGITNDWQFLDHITSYIGEFLRDNGYEFIYERLIVPSLGSVTFSKTLNRSVTGSMTDMVFLAKVHLVEQETSLYDVSQWLNQVPMSYLERGCPKDAFEALSIEGIPMTVAEIEDVLEQNLLHDEAMQYGLYEYELEELLDEFKSSLAADRDDFIFTVTENSGDVAMVLIEKSGQVYINEQAREKLQALWPAAYKSNIQKLIPAFAQQLHAGELPVNGVKTMELPRFSG